MMGKKERTAAPFLWGLGPPNKQKREDAASGRSSAFRKSYILFHCLPIPKSSECTKKVYNFFEKRFIGNQ